MPLPLLAPLAPLFLPIATFLGFYRNTSKQIDTNKEISKQQQVQQLKIAHLNIQAQKDLEEKRQQFQENLEENRQQHQENLEESRQQLQTNLEIGRQRFQERMSNLGFKQQKTLREFDQAFQSKLRELDYEHQQKVEEFRSKVNVAINQKNLDFQAWKVEQEMGLQKELAAFNRETQLEIAAYQRETALNMPEINKVYENWPLKNPPMQILNSHPNHLRIFISPPALDYDRFTNLNDPKNHNFPKIEGFLGGRLLKLLNQHYPRNDTLRPTHLLDDAWDSKRFCGGSSIVALADRLESEPFVVLESRVILNKYLSLRVAYKGASQKDYFYDEIIPRWEYGDILLAAAKIRMGKISQTEETQIQVTSDDWEMLYRVLETAHCLVAGWIADVHHLLYHNASPLLPHILPELVKELPDFLLTDTNSLLVQLMQEVVKGYQNVFQALELTEQCYQVPELFLELAQGLASLPEQSMAKEQTKESILAFLRTRNCTDLKVIDYREQTENILVSGDSEYFDKLEKFISSTGKENVIPEANNLLQAWNAVVSNRNKVLENRATVVMPTKPTHQIGETMSNTLTTIFDNKYKRIQGYYSNWSKLQKQIKHLLGNSTSEETASIVEDDLELQEEVKKFKYEIDNPRITLATTGTTSGGKSSLVNLLCGAEIIPVAVQEMSAGTVIIDHNFTERTLKISPVQELPADYSGEWSDLSDQDIRRRLQQVMDGYRKLREENREPPAPLMEIQYPTRLGLHPEIAGLPEGFRLRIIDLPGLKYVADNHNRQVIRDQIKPALCLVTYNSEETDPDKQKKLLEEVVEQVRELRGSPARMLFVLNRIDVFRRDENWEEQTQNFTDKTLDKIRTEVARALPEYHVQAKKLRVQPLSTGPALPAYQALNFAALRVQSLEKIEKTFTALIPDELIDDLPRKISKWTENDCKQVAEAVWRSSYGYDFDKTLRVHIQNNIPQLLLPHLIKSVTDVGGEALTNAHQIAHAHLNATEQRYQAECARLDNIGSDLRQLRDESKQQLLTVLDFSGTKEGKNIIDLLQNSSIQLEKIYQLPKDSLIPLYDWSTQINNTILEFLGAVGEAILEGNYSSQHPIIASLPPQERQALSDMLVNLNISGYGDYTENGGHFDEIGSYSQKENLKQMNRSLNKLAEVIANSLKRVLERMTERETGRIQDALQTLVERYTDLIGKQTHSLAPDMIGLKMPPSKVSRIEQQLTLSFPLTAGFPVHRYKKEVKTGTKQVWDGTKEVKVGTKQVKVGEKRLWYTLWLAKENVYETRNVYETQDKYKAVAVYEKRNYEAATIPSITDIFGSFIEQARASRTEDQFVKWLLDQIGQFMTGIEKYQDELLEKYRARLDQARQQATQQREIDVGKWEPVVEEATGLQEKLDGLLKVD